MSNYKEEIWVLITRVLSGEATSLEQVEFRKWLDADPKHKEFFKNIESTWRQGPEQSAETFLFDYDSGLNKLKNKLNREASFYPNKGRFQRRSFLNNKWMIAAAILLAILISVFTNIYLWEEPVSVNTYVTSGVEQRIITLEDGSVVRLNRNSKIDIEVNNALSVREVKLEGEAFFDVAEDPDRPFIIHVEKAVVRVLGTSFNVKNGDEVMVAVQEGTVSLRHKKHEEKSAATLTAGNIGLLSENGQDIKIEETNIENYKSWMNGYLKFDSMPFDQVIRQLERIYGVKHELADPSLSSVQLTVNTERMQREEVLKTIALTLDLTYQEQEGVIHWQREGQRTSK